MAYRKSISLVVAAAAVWLGTLALSAASATPLLRRVFTFPPNHFIENLAVRSNGELLITSMSVNTLSSLDPTVASPNVSVLHTFPAGHGLMGITELGLDVFVVVSGIWDLALTRAQRGSLTVWTVKLASSSVEVRKVSTVKTSIQLNGLAPVPGSTELILAADADAGAVYRINITTGTYDIAFSDPFFEPVDKTSPGQHLGINGIRTSGAHLYFTNSAKQLFGRLRIDRLGNRLGAVDIISNNPVQDDGPFGSAYDDFALDDRTGVVWIATHPSNVVRVGQGGHQLVVTNHTLLLNPTSAQFGRGSAAERGTLYVTNGGEFAPDFTLFNEGVVALDTAQV